MPISISTSPYVDATSPVINDAQWSYGNFEIVSADNISFRCDHYVLIHGSPMIAAMYGIPSCSMEQLAPRMCMTHKKVESATIVRMFLEIATHRRFPKIWTNEDFGLLFRFLYKWRFDALREHLIMDLRGKLLVENWGSLDVFIVGAIGGELDLCRAAFEANCAVASERYLVRDTIEPFDPACWATEFWQNCPIPRDYLVALKHAWCETSVNGRSTVGFYAEFAEKLHEIRDPRSKYMYLWR
ncbi:uncharacterized protein CcaverHIS019_0404600 [Cutaneotrichosporon cavernicola]|uniref:BTB domain-containing protein n=1 Tax=Cutaneotrichosporon cavernicola TaxID=279322 RepID=A0AA48L472_9TREE|nr:uncharacterized protein CcaverHIS019_0404600 [Cutaneotrichosporon cavernicola]BEI91640.1 hypothetical protein CcaverHIS019_0404600 [Cutaneotrichosporon cavernicola]BEI99416.1 hypothetical protein CcaverHIS631_0404590 [Cutaneotrichosporon cavernicola]BEJ07194.1 hypothetical protein CcaverHIS641_0404630 [Cutaneotrichosporon cavernicola]